METIKDRPTSDNADLPPPGYLTRFAEIKVTKRNLPHWEHPGVAVFVTFRLGDSIPAERIVALNEELEVWRNDQPDLDRDAMERTIADRRRERLESLLDECMGSCVLALEGNRRLVEEALHYYDGKRIALYGYVVMPNHVHILFMPLGNETIKGVIRDLKHYVSGILASAKTWAGDFWQREYWDTFIRDERHFARVLAYIRGNNPAIAYDAYVRRGATDPLV